ncbi:hypothetical protein B0H14DRAFT_3438708 [Mycena olivaceomarginata]|nr:hypothetical protein B0H14DRAFT_3438708 [Mycena olivaceomarginata]
MTNNRRNIAGPTTRKYLKARAYLASGRPKSATVEVRCPTPDRIRTSRRNPTVEGVMNDARIQSYIHDVHFRVCHRLPSGVRAYTTFRCYFKRHARLPRNKRLDVRGDIVVMCAAANNFYNVVGMRAGDDKLADFVAQRLAVHLREFQADPNLKVKPHLVTMPGAFP